MPAPQDFVGWLHANATNVEREYPGYTARVPFVWCNEPNARLGICSQEGAQHCAGTIGEAYFSVGLVPGRDYPDPFVYCPGIGNHSEFQVDAPQVGDWVLIDWQDDGELDHCEGVVGVDNWPASVTTAGANTDESGHINFFERPAGLIKYIGRPKWPTAAAAGGQDAGTPAGRVYAWCRANGWSDAGAAGLLGNLQQESNFWFDAVEGQGQVGEIPEDQMLALIVPGRFEGVGVLQWSFERRTNLLAYCHSAGLPWYSPEAQMGFLQKELEEGYAPLLKALKNATDPVSAAIQLDSQFIRSGVKGARYDYAREQYKQIQAGDYAIGAAPSDDTALIVGAFILLGVI